MALQLVMSGRNTILNGLVNISDNYRATAQDGAVIIIDSVYGAGTLEELAASDLDARIRFGMRNYNHKPQSIYN